VRTEQQILIEGAATELNFRCTFGKNATTASGASFATSSSLSTTLTRTEAAALLQAAAPAQTATSLLGRDTLASTLRLGESNVIIETCLTCGDVSMPTYRVSVKISGTRRYLLTITHSVSQSLTHSLTHLLTHSLAHSLTHLLAPLITAIPFFCCDCQMEEMTVAGTPYPFR
jgi:hypothetical protein